MKLLLKGCANANAAAESSLPSSTDRHAVCTCGISPFTSLNQPEIPRDVCRPCARLAVEAPQTERQLSGLSGRVFNNSFPIENVRLNPL